MKHSAKKDNASVTPTFLTGGGKMGEIIRAHAWSETPLGPVYEWPQSLRTVVSICLNSNFPIAIYWGRELTLIYNDAWSPIPGNKHPWALGKPAKEVWPDIWDDIEPQFKKAFTGEPGGSKDALLPMQRHGYTEECYFDFTFTPVYGEQGVVEGVFNAVIETTFRITTERRTDFLKNFALQIATANTKEDLFSQALDHLKNNAADLPFVLSYSTGKPPLLLASTIGTSKEEEQPDPDLPFDKLKTSPSFFIKDLSLYFPDVPKNFWPESPVEGYLLSLVDHNGEHIGTLMFGLSARRRFDEDYRLYLESIGSTILKAYNIIAALEEERKKSEALAEIDKAKTVFFSNISHEFRTPLTLILGSLEELLTKHTLHLSATERQILDTTHRNAIRLLRLVNNLLDFSRVEAGKARARYQLTDIVKLTKDIAGSFRSLMENAGLRFVVHCDAFIQPVYIDRVMWEKIVLNLLSNAFKFTMNGSVTVTLEAENSHAVLRVKDTGPGIPPEELPHMFERFHRVDQVQGRSFEGTGIGLSLISELVKLHKGMISVESGEGSGAEFIVTIPFGKEHLPSAQVMESSTDEDLQIIDSFAAEATSLLSHVQPDGVEETEIFMDDKPIVLVVDDNADMRHYFRSLLSKDYKVITAGDGAEALNKLKLTPPSLVVSDIMMPVMDGVELLQRIKEDAVTSSIPVILVSARAGENERIEGYDLGADDYLVKPFSSKELLARVRSQINIARKRNKIVNEVYNVFDEVPFAIAVLKGKNLVIEYINQYNLMIWQKTKEEVLGKPLFEARPDIRQSAEGIHSSIFLTGKRFSADEVPVNLNINGNWETRYFNVVIDPLFDESGRVTGQLATSIEITDQVIARKKIEESEKEVTRAKEQLELTIENVPASVYLFDSTGKIQYANKTAFNVLKSILGEEFNLEDDVLTMTSKAAKKADYMDENNELVLPSQFPAYAALKTGKESELILQRVFHNSDQVSWFLSRATPLVDHQGKVQMVLSTSTDFTIVKQAEEKIRESEKRFRILANALPQMVWMRDVSGTVEFGSRHWEDYSGVKGVSAAWKEMVHPEDWNDVMGLWEKKVQLGQSFRFEVRLKNKAGEYRWHYGVVEPVKDESGVTVKWIGALTDIHHQKEFSRSLEQQVSERTAELARSNEDLQQFAHVASHDLKEPVRKIVLFSNKLKAEMSSGVTASTANYLQKIEKAARRMYAMIDGVLLYSSMDAMQETPQDVDIKELVNNIIDDLEILIQDKSAEMRTENLPILKGSPVFLYQLFYNLINNSLKFSRPGTPPIITITGSSVSKKDLPVKNLPFNRYFKFTVEDNGIGFNNKQNERIFSSFIRLHSKDTYEGTGLGLALCRKIVERHKGFIFAESEEGQGARFTILLPET